jgi:hypothetical protein
MLPKPIFVKPGGSARENEIVRIILNCCNYYIYIVNRQLLDHIRTFLKIEIQSSGLPFWWIFRKECLVKEAFYRPLRAKGAVFLCALVGIILAACSPSSSVNLKLDSDILSLATNTKKLPVSIDEKIINDTIAAFYRDETTRREVLAFFSSLTKSETVAKAILDNAIGHDVPASLAFAIAYEESKFNPRALNENANSTDRGLFQLNSLTFPEMTDGQAFDPRFNAQEGVKYFRHVLDISGNEVSALAMYNAGRTRVSKSGAPVTTLGYISRVLNYEKNIDSLFTAKVVAKASLLGSIRMGLASSEGLSKEE